MSKLVVRRFSLRWIFCALAVMCAVFAGVSIVHQRWRDHRAVVSCLEQIGADYTTSSTQGLWPPTITRIELAPPKGPWIIELPDGRQLSGWDELEQHLTKEQLKELHVPRKAVDQDLFYVLKRATRVRELFISGTSVSNDGLAAIRYCRSLDQLVLGAHSYKSLLYAEPPPITDAGLVNLVGVKVRAMSLRGLPITDRGMVAVGQLKSLERLDLVGTRVSDEGLMLLCGLPNLKYLELQYDGDSAFQSIYERHNGRITHAGVEALRREMPECQIVR